MTETLVKPPAQILVVTATTWLSAYELNSWM